MKITPVFILIICLFEISPLKSAELIIATKTKILAQNENFLPEQQLPYQFLTHPPIVGIDRDWRWACYLCESLPTFKNGLLRQESSGKFQLRSNWKLKKLFWSNGKPLTAFDVLRTYRYLKKFKPNRNFYGITSIKVSPKDPLSFEVHFTKKRSDYAKLMNFSIMPHPENKKTKNLANLSYGDFVATKKNSLEIHLRRTLTQQTQNSIFHKIKIKHFRTSSEILRCLEEKSCNFVLENEFNHHSFLNIEAIVQNKHSQLESVYSIGNSYEALIFNLQNPLLTDTAVRQAIRYALDINGIIKSAYQGIGKQATSPFHDRDPLSPNLKFQYKNIDLAKYFLEQAGWKLNDKGVRAKFNQVLRFKITTSQSPRRKKIIKLIARDLKKTGIVIEADIKSYKKFILVTIPQSRFRDFALVSRQISPGVSHWSAFHSTQIPSSQNQYQGTNVSGLNNKDFDKTLNSLYTTFEKNQQRTLTRIFTEHYTNIVPEIPIAYNPVVAIIPKFLANFFIPGNGTSSLFYINTWSKKTATISKLNGMPIIK